MPGGAIGLHGADELGPGENPPSTAHTQAGAGRPTAPPLIA
jgi:hypothetical protein